MNPYYDPEELDLELCSFDEPGLIYEYNTLCFWATRDGEIYSASDAGCSCPTPFEDRHDRPTREEVLQTLERVGSVDQALQIYDAWNDFNLPVDERRALVTWVKRHLKP